MAVRRMFSIVLINSDAFIDLSNSAKVVYFYLMSKADDDGFVNGITSVIRVTKCKSTDVDELIIKGFLIKLSEKVYIISHWKQQNIIQPSKKQQTLMNEYKDCIELEDEVYHLSEFY